MKVYIPSSQTADVKDAKPASDDSAIPSYRLQGYQEGKWLREWEPSIRRAIYRRYQGTLDSTTFPSVTGSHDGDPRELLDGYVA